MPGSFDTLFRSTSSALAMDSATRSLNTSGHAPGDREAHASPGAIRGPKTRYVAPDTPRNPLHRPRPPDLLHLHRYAHLATPFSVAIFCPMLFSRSICDYPKNHLDNAQSTPPMLAESKDVLMVDMTNAGQDPPQEPQHSPPQRRKSTLILTDDIDMDQMNLDRQPLLTLHSTELTLDDLAAAPPLEPPADPNGIDPNVTIPVDIKWVQGGDKVYVTGLFTGWRKMIGLVKQPDNTFLVTLGLPAGTHRFRFVIDNELRYLDFLPTATDQMGNFVNYIEVTPDHIYSHLASQDQQPAPAPQPERRGLVALTISRRQLLTWGLTNDDDDMGDGYLRYHDGDTCDGVPQKRRGYISDIPPIFYDPKVMEQYYVAIDKQLKLQLGQQQAWLHPPQLPPHLEHVILNQYNQNDHDNNLGALPIPNHVVLNHLATTLIKHNTLAVALVVRYKQKYVTQVLYAPLQTN